jgi:O-antigen ligase
MPEARDEFAELFVVEGVDGNDRWDLWSGTVDSFLRSPVIGSGLGSYRHVIGLDKPATGTSILEQAHNDWLEWTSTAGIFGIAVLGMFLIGVGAGLRPSSVRGLRFDLRYPLAGAATAFTATALHEMVGFGLQTPVNRYLFAAWVGLVWGIRNRVEAGKQRERQRKARDLESGSDENAAVDDTADDGFVIGQGDGE